MFLKKKMEGFWFFVKEAQEEIEKQLPTDQIV